MSAPATVQLSIVLPAFREAESLDALLPRIQVEVAALTPAFEIVVVDAMEKLDMTQEICAGHGVRHVFRTGGNHFGDAVRSGIRAANGEFIIFMDADGSHNPEHIARLWTHRNGYDVVIGSRYVAGGSTENPAILIFMSWVVNLTFRLCFGLQCRDVTNSFRLYRADKLKALQLESDNFDIVEEILIRLCTGPDHGTAVEVPIVFERRKAGESKRSLPAFAASYMATILRLMCIRSKTFARG